MVTQFFSSGGFESLMAGVMANMDEQVITIVIAIMFWFSGTLTSFPWLTQNFFPNFARLQINSLQALQSLGQAAGENIQQELANIDVSWNVNESWNFLMQAEQIWM